MTARCRWASVDDVPRIAEFLLEGFGPASIQCLPGRFEWLLVNNPFGFHATIAESGGRIVAFRGCLPFSCEGLPGVRAAFGMDFLVLPEHRRQGIGRSLLQLALERFELAVTTAPSPANEQLYRGMGARELTGVYSAFCRCARPAGNGRPRSLARDWVSYAYYRCLAAPRAQVRQVDLEGTCERAVDGAPRLAGVEFGASRGAEFLRWRYGRGPYARDYVLLELGQGGSSPAVAVVRPTAGGVALVDLLCGPDGRSGALAALAGGRLGDSTTSLFAGEPLKRAFRRAGYLARRSPGAVLALSRHEKLLTELSRLRWISFPGDSDMDLVRQPAPIAPGV